MIPPAQRMLQGFPFLALRYGFTDGPTLHVLTALRDEAVRRAEEPRDEPAALFFAGAHRPYYIGESWPLLTVVLARNHAERLRLHLAASMDELHDLALDVNLETTTYEHVRDWFRERLRPY